MTAWVGVAQGHAFCIYWFCTKCCVSKGERVVVSAICLFLHTYGMHKKCFINQVVFCFPCLSSGTLPGQDGCSLCSTSTAARPHVGCACPLAQDVLHMFFFFVTASRLMYQLHAFWQDKVLVKCVTTRGLGLSGMVFVH